MLRSARWIAAVSLLSLSLLWAADAHYSIKATSMSPPKEIHDPIRRLLSEKSIQVLDDKGNSLCELWFCKEVPAKATPEQVKNGLTYRELEESTVLGAVRFNQQASDYRKQKVKPGVYTLRLGFQPMDGDHMGTAPYPEFCLLVPAKLDEKPDIVEAKELRELSAKAIGGSHPGVFLLFPIDKPEDAPKLDNKGSNTWVVTVKEPVTVGGQKVVGSLGIGLTVVGHTTAE
jgi:hypothetical protein